MKPNFQQLNFQQLNVQQLNFHQLNFQQKILKTIHKRWGSILKTKKHKLQKPAKINDFGHTRRIVKTE